MVRGRGGDARSRTDHQRLFRPEAAGMTIANAVLQGIFLGAFYAVLACGLSIMFGVMRIINLAHGDIAVLGAYVVFVIVAGHRNLSVPRFAGRPAGDDRLRLRAPADRPRAKPQGRHPHAAAGDLRAVDRDPEPAAHHVLARRPLTRRRARARSPRRAGRSRAACPSPRSASSSSSSRWPRSELCSCSCRGRGRGG